MLKQIVRLRIGLVLLLGIPLFCSGAFAMGNNYREDNRGGNRGDRHYYRDGRWYRHDSTGREIAVTALAIGALVESLPPQHTTVVVQGAPYYYDNSHYYQQSRDGSFVVVRPPRR